MVSAGGRRAALLSRTPPNAMLSLATAEQERDCHTLTFMDELLNTCHLPLVGSNYLTGRTIKIERIT